MKNQLILVGIYALIHLAFNTWCEKSDTGIRFRHFLQTWKTDWFNGIMVSISVFILFCCGILGLVYIPVALGL